MTTPEEVVGYYIDLFAARSDVYSHWTPEGWRPVRQPLSVSVALAGLNKTGPSISAYLISPESRSHVFAIDFDNDVGYEQAIKLGRQMLADGMPVYVETSRRGAHLWGCLDEVMTATDIRKGLRACLSRAGISPNDPKVELRPGSDTIDEDGLGHCLRMPLMPHPKTGKRGRLLSPDSEQPLGERLRDIVMAVDIVPAATLGDLALHWHPALKPSDIPSRYRRPRPRSEVDYGTASEILRDKWGVLNAAPGKAIRCPAHDDREPSLSILKDDQRVICFAPSCVLNNDGHGRGTYELTKLAPHD